MDELRAMKQKIERARQKKAQELDGQDDRKKADLRSSITEMKKRKDEEKIRRTAREKKVGSYLLAGKLAFAAITALLSISALAYIATNLGGKDGDDETAAEKPVSEAEKATALRCSREILERLKSGDDPEEKEFWSPKADIESKTFGLELLKGLDPSKVNPEHVVKFPDSTLKVSCRCEDSVLALVLDAAEEDPALMSAYWERRR